MKILDVVRFARFCGSLISGSDGVHTISRTKQG
jgi:hypothetical protein